MNILAIIGSATTNSSNHKIVEWLSDQNPNFSIRIFEDLSEIPHFEIITNDADIPEKVTEIWKLIEQSDGVLFSTPEYIFSIPAGLKNLLEWCVSTTIFSEKIVAIITASANGEKAHEQLKLIIKTLGGKVDDNCSVLIKGIKGKIKETGIPDDETIATLKRMMSHFENIIWTKLP